MSKTVDELLAHIQLLREELELELQRKREEIEFVIREKRVHFAEEVLVRQHLYKVGLLRYLHGARWPVMLTAPLIYAGIVPFLLLDIFVTVYQAACFPVYGIPTVRRADFMLFDRGDLPYLNIVERINCWYCSYANSVSSYFREVAARSEQYWCPIKHTRRLLGSHDRYPQFFEFGDAEAYRKGLARLRDQYGEDPER